MWTHYKEQGLLVFKSPDFQQKENYGIFSFSKTLIDQPINLAKTANAYPKSVEFLKDFNKSHSIIVFENQKNPISHIKQAVLRYLQLISEFCQIPEDGGLEFLFIFSIKDNRYKKPNTNILQKIAELTDKNLQNLNLIIGNNAGRLQTANYFPDESDNDRAFAYNCSKEFKKDIQFRTPEQIFLKNTESRKWSWRMPAFDQLLALQSQQEPSFQEIINLDADKTAIIISGPPVSTKSTLSKRIKSFIEKQDKQCVTYDSNDYDTFVQFVQDIKPEGNLIVAGAFETNEKRNELWRKLESHNKIFIEIATHRSVCEFLNHFRLQICSSPAIVETKKIEFDMYYKFYQIPELDYISYPLVLRNKL